MMYPPSIVFCRWRGRWIMATGSRSPVLWRRAARMGKRSGSVALASDRAGRAWDCGGVRRELGRPAGSVAERLAGAGATDLSGAGLADVQLSPRRDDTTV